MRLLRYFVGTQLMHEDGSPPYAYTDSNGYIRTSFLPSFSSQICAAYQHQHHSWTHLPQVIGRPSFPLRHPLSPYFTVCNSYSPLHISCKRYYWSPVCSDHHVNRQQSRFRWPACYRLERIRPWVGFFFNADASMPLVEGSW